MRSVTESVLRQELWSTVLGPFDRKLAAIDIAFLGAKLIITEFAGGVILCAALVLFRGHSFWQVVLGLYLISLGINYVPMLVYAVAISTGQSARAEMGRRIE